MELDLIKYEMDGEIKRQIDNILGKFMSKTKVDLIVLCDDAGRIASYKGKTQDENEIEFVASLISGIFGAAAEMAKIMNEGDVLDIVQYESKNVNVLIKAVGKRFLVGVLAPKDASLGSIRLFIKELCGDIETLFAGLKLRPAKVIRLKPEDIERKLNQVLGAG